MNLLSEANMCASKKAKCHLHNHKELLRRRYKKPSERHTVLPCPIYYIVNTARKDKIRRHFLANVHINGEIIVFSLFCCVESLMPLALRVSIIRWQRYMPHLGRLHPLLLRLCTHRQPRRRPAW